MADYKRMYFKMAAIVANCIEILQEVLEQTEDMYMSEEEVVVLLASLENLEKCLPVQTLEP